MLYGTDTSLTQTVMQPAHANLHRYIAMLLMKDLHTAMQHTSVVCSIPVPTTQRAGAGCMQLHDK